MTVETIYGGADPTGLASYNTTTEGSASYTVYFVPSEDGTVKSISYYSPIAAGVLPNNVGIFELDNLTPLVQVTPTWSGIAGSGWITADVTDTAVTAGHKYYAVIALSSGTMEQAYLYDGGTGDVWLPHTSAAGHITAPASLSGFIDGPNGPAEPYQSGSGFSYPFSSPPFALNWLVDVGIEFASASVSISGVAAAVSEAGGVGSVTALGPVNVPGVAAAVSAAGGIGSVHTVDIEYRDSFSGSVTGVSHTSPLVLTVPGTIEEGDQFLMVVNMFTFNANTDADIGVVADAGSWSSLGTGLYNSGDGNGIGLFTASRCLSRRATVDDAGSTITISALGSHTTDTYWITASVSAYSGADGGVDSFSALAGTTPFGPATNPTGVTAFDNEWEVDLGALSIDGAGSITGMPSGLTQRQYQWDSGVNTVIADSNGPIVNAGTTVGGGVFTTSGNDEWYALYVVTLAPAAVAVPVDITGVAAAVTVAGGIGIGVIGGAAHIPGVAAAVSAAGGVGTVTANTAVNVAGVAAAVSADGGIGFGGLQITLTGTSDGVSTYSTFTEINNTGSAGPQDMRVLPPSSPNAGYDHAFLWLLPVEPGQGTTFGDSIGTIQALNAHNDFNLTCIQPGFPEDPWYGNSADDPQTQQETFMLQLVNWANGNLHTTGTEKHYLIGFSKSGFGGQVLFMRNQPTFAGVISWDAAVDYQTISPDEYDGAYVFGEQSRMDEYKLYDPNLATWKTEGDTGTVNRIQLAAGINLTVQTSDYSDRLTADGILHTYTFVETDSHNWAPTPGWVEPSLIRLLGISSGHGSIAVRKPSIAAAGTETIKGTGSVHARKPSVLVTGSGIVTGSGHVSRHKPRISGTSKIVIAGSVHVRTRKPSLSGRNFVPEEEVSELFVFSLL
jgi:hypothetical protein